MYKYHTHILIVALVIFCIGAFFSIGYYHADEHYQIIEFAGIKSGFSTPSNLTWEYNARLRSTVQPTIAYIVIETCKSFSILNPYNQLTVLKLISAIFAALSIRYFVNSTYCLVSKSKLAYTLTSYFLWFIPVVSLRFSSETWGGILTLLTLAYFQNQYLNKNNKSIRFFITLGLLCGIAFLFRFQMIFISFGLFCWLLFYKREDLKNLIWIILGGVIALSIGTAIDYYFYGEFTLTFWNYFYGNIVENIASSFGTSPWYTYFLNIWEIPLFGLIVITSFILFSIKKYNSVYLWILIPFILIHTIIGHKEIRFLFPIVYFIPLIITLSYNYLQDKIFYRFKLFTPILIGLFILINLIFFTVNTIKQEDDNGRHLLSKYIYENYQDVPVNIISTGYSSPYSPFGAKPRFYLTQNVTETKIGDFCELDSSALKKNMVNLFVFRKFHYEKNNPCNANVKALGFKFVMQSVPKSIENIIFKYYDSKYTSRVLVLMEH